MDMLIKLNKSNNLWAMFTQSVSNTNPILQNCVDCGVTLFKELSMSKKKKTLIRHEAQYTFLRGLSPTLQQACPLGHSHISNGLFHINWAAYGPYRDSHIAF